MWTAPILSFPDLFAGDATLSRNCSIQLDSAAKFPGSLNMKVIFIVGYSICALCLLASWSILLRMLFEDLKDRKDSKNQRQKA